MPLVSIVLPTYNRAHLIKRSIETCLSQTLKDIELIVVNDCSTDNTKEIVETFVAIDARVRLINNEKNLKLPGSLNKGFDIAKGKYFTWTSDDNLYARNALEVLSQTLEEDPTADLVYADYNVIDENDKITGQGIMNDINKSFMLWKGCGSCFMYKAAIHQINKGYDPTLFLIEDYDFFLRASLKYKFIYLDRTDLYSHRNHSGSLTSLQGHAVFELQKIIVERKRDILFPHFSLYDKMLFFRKYAVYYAVLKNNVPRMNFYMAELWKASKKDYVITFLFISVQKIGSFFKVNFGLISGFIKIVFGSGK
jgi:glycosyltransferase involved in cell wall biosynthesis